MILLDEEGVTNRKQVLNRKKTTYNGELICQRKFCRMCLKWNYDIKIVEIVQKTNWACLFCQAICLCSRCQRNDTMKKLKDLQTISGRNLDLQEKDSIFEEYETLLNEEQHIILQNNNQAIVKVCKPQGLILKIIDYCVYRQREMKS